MKCRFLCGDYMVYIDSLGMLWLSSMCCVGYCVCNEMMFVMFMSLVGLCSLLWLLFIGL